MTKSRSRKLSELEGVCLGIVFKRQPCTAYKLRNELKKAPSSHWRASAGSVYPLLTRLEQDDLIESTSDENDGRGRKLIRVTSIGRNALKKWLVAGGAAETISSVTDPVRSRMFFLGALSRANQLEYVDELIGQMQHYLSETFVHLEAETESGDVYDYLGALGATKITKARLDWLHEVRKHLSDAETS